MDEISKLDYEREIDAACADDDPDLFDLDRNTGHPADFDPLGGGFTYGQTIATLKARVAAAQAARAAKE